MARQLFTNNADSNLSGALSQGGTTLTLASGTGERFPAPGPGDFFLLTLYEKDPAGNDVRVEVVRVTQRVGDTLTITRDFESMTGQSGGLSYPSSPEKVVFVSLRFTAAGAMGMLQTRANLSDIEDLGVARANLGITATVVPFTPAGGIVAVNVQAAIAEVWGKSQNTSPILTALAGLTYGADRLPYATGAQAFATTALTSFARTLLDDATAAAARTTLGLGGAAVLSVGTTAGTVMAGDRNFDASYQPINPALTALAAVSTVGVLKRTGANAYTALASTTAGEALLTAPSAAAQRVAMGLGGASTLNVGTTAGTVMPGDRNFDGRYQPLNDALTGIAELPATQPDQTFVIPGRARVGSVYSWTAMAVGAVGANVLAAPDAPAARAAFGLGNVDDVGAAALRDRTTHTGVQPIGSVSGLQAALDDKMGKTDSAPNADRLTTARNIAGVAFDGTQSISIPYANLTGLPGVVTTTVQGFMSAADKVKLNGIATAATANATNAQLRDRTTHTGVQAIATVDGLQAALDLKVSASALSPPNLPTAPGDIRMPFALTRRIVPGLTTVRAGDSWDYNAQGLLVRTAENRPVMGFNLATGESMGLSSFGTSMNILTHSEDLSLSGSTSFPGLVGISIIGGWQRVVEAEGGTWHYFQSTFGSHAANVDLMISVEARQSPVGARRYLSFVWTGSALSANHFANFDLVTGEVRSTPLVTARAVRTRDGWMCYAYVTTAQIGQASAQLRLSDIATAASPSYAGDGVSGVELRYPQLSTGRVLGPYVPTLGAAVARPADIHRRFYPTELLSTYATWMCRFSGASYSSNAAVLAAGDTEGVLQTGPNHVRIGVNVAGNLVASTRANGVSSEAVIVPTPEMLPINTAVMTLGARGVSVYVNGKIYRNWAGIGLPRGMQHVSLGHGWVNPFNGWILDAEYWSRELTDSEALAISAS